jgi:uncharacterized membrane protein
MTLLAYLGAGLMAVLGTLHLVYTIRDILGPPRYFCPKDTALLAQLQNTSARIAPHGRTYWSGLMGFHLSHSLGVLMFALLVVLATVYAIAWLKPLLVAVGMIFAIIAQRCWFSAPLIGISMATALMAAGWIL